MLLTHLKCPMPSYIPKMCPAQSKMPIILNLRNTGMCIWRAEVDVDNDVIKLAQTKESITISAVLCFVS